MLKTLAFAVVASLTLALGSVSFAGDAATHKCCCGDKCACVECKCTADCAKHCAANTDKTKTCPACTPAKPAK